VVANAKIYLESNNCAVELMIPWVYPLFSSFLDEKRVESKL